MAKKRIYCAGPLFNRHERHEMKAISELLRASGYETFLPQEDGLEFARLVEVLETQNVPPSEARVLLARAIFSLDVYKVIEWSDAVVANLNGRVPDEGVLVEATLAWYAGKALVLYKDDDRTLLHGTDNPLWLGLGNFELVTEHEKLPSAIEAQLADQSTDRVPRTLSAGEQLALAMQKPRKTAGQTMELAHLVRELFE